MEHLGRGVVAVRASATTVYVGWRLLGPDPAEIAFNVYRSTNGGAPAKLNAKPIATTTDFVDTTADLASDQCLHRARRPRRTGATGERAGHASRPTRRSSSS